MQSFIVMIILNVLVWQQCPTCSSARETHLFLYSKTEILDEMEAVRHLRRLCQYRSNTPQ
jgi:hypothetical protein